MRGQVESAQDPAQTVPSRSRHATQCLPSFPALRHARDRRRARRLHRRVRSVTAGRRSSERPRVGSCGDRRPRAYQRYRQGVSLLSQVLGHRVRRRSGDADRCRRSVRGDRAGSRIGARQAHVLRSDVRGAVQEHHPADPRVCRLAGSGAGQRILASGTRPHAAWFTALRGDRSARCRRDKARAADGRTTAAQHRPESVARHNGCRCARSRPVECGHRGVRA